MLYVSIGFVVCAKRAMTASFFTNMTWLKCQNVTFSRNSDGAKTGTVRYCTLFIPVELKVLVSAYRPELKGERMSVVRERFL